MGPWTRTSNVTIKTTNTLGNILDRYGAPSVIDYLSLDVEGQEYEILRTFPFDKYAFRCMTVEHNAPHQGDAMQKKIRDVLERNGYIFVKGNDDVRRWGHGPIDDFYIHPLHIRSWMGKVKFNEKESMIQSIKNKRNFIQWFAD